MSDEDDDLDTLHVNDLNLQQLKFIRDLLIPLLLKSESSLSLIVLRHPNITIDSINLKSFYHNNISLNIVLKFYTKMWLCELVYIGELKPYLIVSNFDKENIRIFLGYNNF